MKKLFLKFLALSLTLIMLVGVIASCQKTSDTTTTYFLSEEKEKEIIDAYYDYVKDKSQDVKREDIILDFFIALKGAYAMRINTTWIYECKPSSETVNGVKFSYPYGPASSYGVKIYYEGEFYRLSEALDAGIINTDALYVIRDAYNEKKLTHTNGFTFLPDQRSERNAERFKADFFESDYYQDFIEYSAFYNYMPEEISDRFNIDAFEVVTDRESQFYVWYDGDIFRADRVGMSNSSEGGFVQFALDDYNSDGYFELLGSYNQHRHGIPDKSDYSQSHIFVVDTKSRQCVNSYANYDGFIYFKQGDDEHFDAYESKDQNHDNADKLWLDLFENTARYEFKSKEKNLLTTKYLVKITIDEGTVHFPVNFNGADLKFCVTTKMTYLGPTFTYTHSNGYFAGAEPSFVDGEKQISLEGEFSIDVISKFTVKTFDVIERDYNFINYAENPDEEGTYDLVIDYRGTKVKAWNFLKITRD